MIIQAYHMHNVICPRTIGPDKKTERNCMVWNCASIRLADTVKATKAITTANKDDLLVYCGDGSVPTSKTVWPGGI